MDVVRRRHIGHKRQMSAPEIFDRHARRLRRDRQRGDSFLVDRMIDDLIDRLDMVTRRFDTAWVQGGVPRLAGSLTARGVSSIVTDVAPRRTGAGSVCEEDQRVFDDGSFDLVISCGVLDTVADLPGALVLIRRALKPDGLFLAAFTAAPSLRTLRDVVSSIEENFVGTVARFHPQIEVRAAGDLLARAGFALPVADLETLNIAYSGLEPLINDLRDAAATNVLIQRYRLSRCWWDEARAAFRKRASADGRTKETISYVMLTGWAPGPDQPRAARRGSGTSSLAKLLDRYA